MHEVTLQEWRSAISKAPIGQLRHMHDLTVEEIRQINLELPTKKRSQRRAIVLQRLRLIQDTIKHLKAKQHRMQQEREGENYIAGRNSGLSYAKTFVEVVREKFPPDVMTELENETRARLVTKEKLNGNK